jgi:hypothetical protein
MAARFNSWHPDEKELELLIRTVGSVAVQWGQAEQLFNLATAISRRSFGSEAQSKRVSPTSASLRQPGRARLQPRYALLPASPALPRLHPSLSTFPTSFLKHDVNPNSCPGKSEPAHKTKVLPKSGKT